MVWTMYTLVEQCVYLMSPFLYMEVLLFEFCIVLLPPSPGSTDEPYPRMALYLRVLHRTLYHVLQLIHFQGWHCTLYHCTKGGRWRRSEFKWLRNTWFEPHLLPRSIGIIRFYLSLNSNQFERVLPMDYLFFAKLVVASSSHRLLACFLLFLPSFHNDWL